jgi:putative transposase
MTAQWLRWLDYRTSIWRRHRREDIQSTCSRPLRHRLSTVSQQLYLDESGFEPDYPQLYAWAPRGQKVHGERNAQRRPRQNLLAARQGDAFLATMLISGSVNAEVFETWLAEHLCRELTAPSVLILDNARFHRPEAIEAIATAAGHQVLFLPPYSPDFNKIEHDFAALKRILAYAPEGTTLDEVVANYHCA